MATRNCRTQPLSSSTKRPSISHQPKKKVAAAKAPVPKKRTALADVTNLTNGSKNCPTVVAPPKPMVPCPIKISKKAKEISSSANNVFPASLSAKSSVLVPCNSTVVPAPSSLIHAFRSRDVSPSRSVSGSVSLDESMSTCDSLNSPVHDIDNVDISEAKSIGKKTTNSLCSSDCPDIEGSIWKKDIFFNMETTDELVDVDNNNMDPQFCATIASGIYKHLRKSETNRRPSVDFMERIQNDISASMRAILIDWLVEVAEEFRLVPDTLFLTVNYLDRYLSVNVMDRKRLQLLGVACIMIAAKYEEIVSPEVEEFCYLTDNTYAKEEVLLMESDVLNHLKFEMTAPTAMCFLRRFCYVAQRTSEVPSLHFECLAFYIAELSLLEYSMLCYAPSLTAASAVFLAKYILSPLKKPWNSTLRHHTLYQASDLSDCVKMLHHLCCNGCSLNLPAVREKYCQHKYKFVAKKYCPPSIPPEFFLDI